MAWFLFRNGFVLFTTNDRLVDFALRVADDRLSRDASALWIEKRAARATWTDERLRKWRSSLAHDELSEVRQGSAPPPSATAGDRTTRFMAYVANLLRERTAQ